MIRLAEIRDAFEGVIPSVVATTDAVGMPNISYLSHVYYVDERHVALSNQFFSKTAENVKANGLATVLVVDGHSGQHHILDLVFESAQTRGEVFDRVASHLSVSVAEQGMADVMKLKAVDIYRVVDIHKVPTAYPLELPRPETLEPRDPLELTARLAGRIAAESDAEPMLDLALEGLERLFGFDHAMVLVSDEERGQLTTIASRGYDRFGFGAEIPFGIGVIGMAAATCRPVRISDLRRSRRYVSAVKSASGFAIGEALPLPALPSPLSQLAVPMLAQGRLTGVLFVESEKSFAFRHHDEEALIIIAGHLALALTLAEQERVETDGHVTEKTGAETPAADTRQKLKLRFYPRDGSMFIGEDYLIRGVPGRLLRYFVEDYIRNGRQDFSNREIRRDRSLQLPEFKDNLETRLILLGRRLEEKGGPIRLLRPERGRVRIEFDGVPELAVVED